jgi:excinuclease ABC subunit A
MELDRPERIRLNKNKRHTIEAVVDRLVVRDGTRIRLTDSIETALKWGGNRVVALRQPRSDGVIKKWGNEKINTSTLQDSSAPTVEWEELRYPTDYGNAEAGIRIGELTPRHFSFNSHLGACRACHKLGTQSVCDPDLMISDPSKTLAEDAITPWRRGTKRLLAYYQHLQKALVKHFHVDEDMPFSELPEQFKQALYFGTNGTPTEMDFSDNGPAAAGKVAKPLEGLVPQMQRLYEQTQSEFTRNRIRSFMTYEPCKVCNGASLKPEILDPP